MWDLKLKPVDNSGYQKEGEEKVVKGKGSKKCDVVMEDNLPLSGGHTMKYMAHVS